MRLYNAAPAQPTGAERVRSVLTAARTMTLHTHAGRAEMLRTETGDLLDRVHLRPLLPPLPGARAALPGKERTPATLELTDIAPVPARDRVRCRVTVTGRLLRAHPTAESRCVQVERAVLRTANTEYAIGVEELLTTPADPLATSEAGMLTHLTDHHEELVPLLMRLVEPRLAQGVVRALPLALDRYGMTLRLEYARGHHDARLPFPGKLDDADQTGVQVHALLVAARRATRQGVRAPGAGRRAPGR